MLNYLTHFANLTVAIVCLHVIFLSTGCDKDESSPKGSGDATSHSSDPESAYGKELAKIKSLGEPTTLAELNTWQKEVPSGENPALAYLESRKSIPSNANELYGNYQKAYSKWRRSKSYNPSIIAIHPSLLPSVRAQLIAHNAHINELLNLQANSLPNQPARFPVDWNNGFSTTLPHLAWLKQDATLLIQRSRIFADAGNAGEAIRSILAAHHLAHLLDGEPSFVSVNQQGSIFWAADAQIERLLNRFTLNDAQLLALHQSIASFNVPAQYANAFIGERCVTISAEGIARTGSPAEIQRIDNEGFLLEEKLIQHLKTRSEAERDLDMVFYVEFHERMISLFKSGYPNLPTSHEKYNEARETLAQISERNKLISGNSNPKYILSQMLLKTFTKETGKDSKHWKWALQQQLTGTAIAIERYRLANRKLPQSLNQLVPQYLSSLPVDPYNEGKQLRYSAGANGSFMLSSIESDNQKPKHPHPAPDTYTFGVNPAWRGR